MHKENNQKIDILRGREGKGREGKGREGKGREDIEVIMFNYRCLFLYLKSG